MAFRPDRVGNTIARTQSGEFTRTRAATCGTNGIEFHWISSTRGRGLQALLLVGRSRTRNPFHRAGEAFRIGLGRDWQAHFAWSHERRPRRCRVAGACGFVESASKGDEVMNCRIVRCWLSFGKPRLGLVLLAAMIGAPFSASARERIVDEAELVVRIPREGTPEGLVARVCLTGLRSPAPLVIVNHGSPSNPSRRDTMEPSSCRGGVAQYFTSRAYNVAFPLRRGYGATRGRWAEGFGPCDFPDFVRAGQATADDIAVSINHFLKEPYVAKRGLIVIGHSAGGWGTLALASRNPHGVATFINFAGGRGGHRKPMPDANCSPAALVAAAGAFGRTARQNTLWIYTENDTFFGPELSRRMYKTFTASGGRAEFHLLPPFGDDGHRLFSSRGGAEFWGPVVERWMSSTH